MAAERGAVVITGASSGIGEACAVRLAGMGFQVFAGVRKVEDGATLQQKTPGRLTPVIIDVTDDATIRAAAETAAQAVGEAGLAGLINNAGVAIAGPLEFLPISELRRQLEINVVGQVAVTQALLPLIRKGRGRIVNISSISGKIASPMTGAYAASKHAMEAVSDALRLELLPWDIKVVVVEPGVTQTPIWQRSLATGDTLLAQMPPQIEELYGKSIAATRKAAQRNQNAGTPPDEVAKVVVTALTIEHPKARYPVGRDARLGSLLARILPDRTRDRMLSRRRSRERWR
ncbi:MAG TPA: SDR family oxidoreductase [Ktedonobacterales bacterium]|nr:SDR family oxidoreductase [Ktedonobacterales bacterium]